MFLFELRAVYTDLPAGNRFFPVKGKCQILFDVHVASFCSGFKRRPVVRTVGYGHFHIVHHIFALHIPVLLHDSLRLRRIHRLLILLIGVGDQFSFHFFMKPLRTFAVFTIHGVLIISLPEVMNDLFCLRVRGRSSCAGYEHKTDQRDHKQVPVSFLLQHMGLLSAVHINGNDSRYLLIIF